MTATSDTRPDPRAALDAARVVFGTPDGVPAAALWSAAQLLLQHVIGRAELTGQALVSEVRRLGRITLSDAHALVALSTWADRATGAASNEAERLIVREAWMALDHAAANAIAAHATAAAATASPYAPPPIAPPAGTPRPHPSWSPPSSSATPGGASGAASSAPDDETHASSPSRRGFDFAIGVSHPRKLMAALALLVVVVGGAAGAVWWYGGRAERTLDRGIEAYQRGSREAARVAFAEAAQLDPDDARPLVYLGRISREDGDLARARRFLTTAVRVAPGSAIATRELASLMLADGQPEIARRFYVRALEIDPSDRSAQGFLGCALARLQRFDEAQRWIQRAGPGDWQRCLPVMPMLPPPPVR